MSDLHHDADDSLDITWSDWIDLNPENDELSSIPTDPGLYRVRHRARGGLAYIGETGRSTRGRVRSLARGTYATEMPFRDPHTAAPCLWAIGDTAEADFEVSVAAPERAVDEQARKGIEAALIALYRRTADESPIANFGRIISGYKQSSYRRQDDRGGVLSQDESEPNSTPGIGPSSWENATEIQASDWMGLDWSGPFRLQNRLDATPPENGLYRIWYDGDDQLAYVGESSNVPRRLYNHQQTFGDHALFAYTTDMALDAAHKRVEIETDLIGAHHLACGEPPLAQFGYDENLPSAEGTV